MRAILLYSYGNFTLAVSTSCRVNHCSNSAVTYVTSRKSGLHLKWIFFGKWSMQCYVSISHPTHQRVDLQYWTEISGIKPRTEWAYRAYFSALFARAKHAVRAMDAVWMGLRSVQPLISVRYSSSGITVCRMCWPDWAWPNYPARPIQPAESVLHRQHEHGPPAFVGDGQPGRRSPR